MNLTYIHNHHGTQNDATNMNSTPWENFPSKTQNQKFKDEIPNEAQLETQGGFPDV